MPRALTQEISRYVFVHARDAGGRPVAGLRYLSRLGDDLVNWAIFETEPPSDTTERADRGHRPRSARRVRDVRPQLELTAHRRYRLVVLAHFSHHEPEDRLPWPWMGTAIVALCVAVVALALLVPDAFGV